MKENMLENILVRMALVADHIKVKGSRFKSRWSQMTFPDKELHLSGGGSSGKAFLIFFKLPDLNPTLRWLFCSFFPHRNEEILKNCFKWFKSQSKVDVSKGSI